MTSAAVKPQVDWLRRASLALALLGAADSAYLAWVKLVKTRLLFCSATGGCETVNTSIYSEINGIPIALLGLGAYLAIVALLALEDRVGVLEMYSPLAVFGLALTGTLYSAYLTYVEFYVLHAVCPYCLTSAVLITAIWILAVVRVRRPPPE
jgi:uncharacterized membrane protein